MYRVPYVYTNTETKVYKGKFHYKRIPENARYYPNLIKTYDKRWVPPKVVAFDLDETISIMFTNNDNMISVKNSSPNTIVESVILYNLLGQSISTWDVSKENQSALIKVLVRDLSAGTYVVRLKTSEGIIAKKIIIKNVKVTSKTKEKKDIYIEKSMLADED